MFNEVLLGNASVLRDVVSITKLLHFLFIQSLLFFLVRLEYSALVDYVTIAILVGSYVISAS